MGYQDQPRNIIGQWVPYLHSTSSKVVLPMDSEHGLVEPTGRWATSTRRIDQWWDTAFDIGDYTTQDAVPHMPDDYTPHRTNGNSLSGNRRTHRMRYAVGSGELRMPSRASIMAYMKDNGYSTIDVPVAYGLTGSDHDNSTAQAWVRITRNTDGTYESEVRQTTASQIINIFIAESVSATMERRRAEITVSNDLLDRRLARQARYGEADIEPNMTHRSSFIRGARFNTQTQTLSLTMSGAMYQYKCNDHTYKQFMDSDSPGRFFNKVFKGAPGSTKLIRCPKCGRFSGADDHLCPVYTQAMHTSDTFRQQIRARRKAKPQLSVLDRPDVSEWMKDTTPDAGWTRAVVGSPLYDYTDAAVIPSAFLGVSNDPANPLNVRGRNGENGVLAFGGIHSQDAAKVLKSIPHEKSDSARDLFQMAADCKVSLAGEVYAPTTGREGITINSITFPVDGFDPSNSAAERIDSQATFDRICENFIGHSVDMRATGIFYEEGLLTITLT